MSERTDNKLRGFSLKSLNRIIKLFFGEEYLNSRIVLALIFSCIFINMVDWLALALFLRASTESMIILHYNVYFGVDLMGNVKQAYFLPLVGLIILAINFSLSIYFYKLRERIATYILLITALAIQLSLLISIISVIIINY